MSADPVVVVGAGIGGLACAAHLAAQSVAVVVVEGGPTVGGKLRTVEIDGQRLDAGPTVMTMRWVFDDLFAALGTSLPVTLSKAEVLARHAWNGASRLDLFADIDSSADAVGAFSGAAEARRYRAFCERARAIYRTLDRPFLQDSRPTPLSLAQRVGWRGLGDLLRISPFATLWSELSTYFHDPRLKQLFGRYATYCGSSPFLAPATLMLIAHVEQDGVWLVDGGMHRIADAVAVEIERHGGVIRCGTPVTGITTDSRRATGVTLADGSRLAAAAVVFNGDTSALADGLLGDGVRAAAPAIRTAQRSLSALTWHLRAQAEGFPLTRHNVFFGGDSEREFDALFTTRTMPGDPTVYVCAQDRDAGLASRDHDGPERLMCLINAPADADAHPLQPEEIARCEALMLRKLAACGLRLERPTSAPIVTTPTDFARLFPATGGALYGRATHGWSASFDRPGSRSRIPGLYLAGGSVHPGPGLPMAALSGKLAAESLMEDRPTTMPRTRPVSTSRSPPAATHGGTSTR